MMCCLGNCVETIDSGLNWVQCTSNWLLSAVCFYKWLMSKLRIKATLQANVRSTPYFSVDWEWLLL